MGARRMFTLDEDVKPKAMEEPLIGEPDPEPPKSKLELTKKWSHVSALTLSSNNLKEKLILGSDDLHIVYMLCLEFLHSSNLSKEFANDSELKEYFLSSIQYAFENQEFEDVVFMCERLDTVWPLEMRAKLIEYVVFANVYKSFTALDNYNFINNSEPLDVDFIFSKEMKQGNFLNKASLYTLYPEEFSPVQDLFLARISVRKLAQIHYEKHNLDYPENLFITASIFAELIGDSKLAKQLRSTYLVNGLNKDEEDKMISRGSDEEIKEEIILNLLIKGEKKKRGFIDEAFSNLKNLVALENLTDLKMKAKEYLG